MIFFLAFSTSGESSEISFFLQVRRLLIAAINSVKEVK